MVLGPDDIQATYVLSPGDVAMKQLALQELYGLHGRWAIPVAMVSYLALVLVLGGALLMQQLTSVLLSGRVMDGYGILFRTAIGLPNVLLTIALGSIVLPFLAPLASRHIFYRLDVDGGKTMRYKLTKVGVVRWDRSHAELTPWTTVQCFVERPEGFVLFPKGIAFPRRAFASDAFAQAFALARTQVPERPRPFLGRFGSRSVPS